MGSKKRVTNEYGQIVDRIIVKFPTMDEVRKHYSSHFEELRNKGDPNADRKEKSFYAAITKDLEKQDADGTITIEQIFVDL